MFTVKTNLTHTTILYILYIPVNQLFTFLEHKCHRNTEYMCKYLIDGDFRNKKARLPIKKFVGIYDGDFTVMDHTIIDR